MRTSTNSSERHGDMVSLQDAARRVAKALDYISDAEMRLLRLQNAFWEMGILGQAAKYAWARAELMPVRSILRGE